MERNVGTMDRWARGIGGLVLFALGFMLTGAWAWIVGIIGIVLVATALFARCPAYSMMGYNTRHFKDLPRK